MPLAVPSGSFAVSTLTIELPARHARSFAAAQFQLQGRDAFRLDTVLITFYYPTSSPSRSNNGINWLPSPRMKSMEGLVKYAGLSRYLVYPAVFILPFAARLPYATNAPLAAPESIPPNVKPDQSDLPAEPSLATRIGNGKFPVGIFSHGLAGTRTTYSQYLAEMASQGMVIAAVEHRDGSAPSSTIQYGDGRKEESLVYFKHDELDKTEDKTAESGSIWDMRKAQLGLRQAEVLEAAHTLSLLNGGKGQVVAEASTRAVEAGALLSEWEGRLDMENLWALGHSFGGATCIELLRKVDAPFKKALVLDPWLEPIAKAGEAPPLQRCLFVINSEAFTIWRTHFGQLRQLVDESRQHAGHAWLMTLTKSRHTDFSDFPLLMPRFFKNTSGVSPLSMVALVAQASVMELVGNFDRTKLTFPIRDEIDGEVDRKDLGKGGQVVWHPGGARINNTTPNHRL